jgi:hypothetical protein
MPPLIKIKPSPNERRTIRPPKGGIASPEAIEAANERQAELDKIWYEIEFGDAWRSILLLQVHPVADGVVVLQAIARPQIPTPFSHSDYGLCVLAPESIRNQKCSLVLPDGRSVPIGFRPGTEEARQWLLLQFAKAAGARTREHNIMTPNSGDFIYKT